MKLEQEIKTILRQGCQYLNKREIDAITIKILALLDNPQKDIEKCG